MALLDRVMDRLLESTIRAAAGGDGAGVLSALVAGQAALAVDERYLVQLYQREVHTLPEQDRRRLRWRQFVDAWAGVPVQQRAGLSRDEARARVHAAMGVIQSVAAHPSGLPRERLTALLVAMAQACLSAA